LSIVLNIAEGSAKKSDKDFNRFIENSLGSVNETVAGLDVAFTNRFISQEDFSRLVQNAEYIAKQLGGFFKKAKE
jgi:four helix bundle protein